MRRVEQANHDFVIAESHRQRPLISDARRHFGHRLARLTMVAVLVSLVMIERGAPRWQYSLLLGFAVWPSIMLWARCQRYDGRRVELVDLHGEFALVGLATAGLVAFNALPTLQLFVNTAVFAMVFGGLRWLLLGLVPYLAGLLVGAALGGGQFAPNTSLFVLAGVVPLYVLPLFSARSIGRVLRSAQQRESRLELQTRRDGLTGLYNRAYWEKSLADAFATCQAGRGPCTLVIADLDHFKRINDAYGHEVGDQVLRAFSTLLCDRLRPHDICGRYGGEEFGILMPATSAREASVLIEQLRGALGSQPLADCGNVTASFGLCEWTSNMADYQVWIRQADRVLYRAKAGGRDQLVVFSEPATGPSVAQHAHTEQQDVLEERLALPPAHVWSVTSASALRS